jgi:hypothetical protein
LQWKSDAPKVQAAGLTANIDRKSLFMAGFGHTSPFDTLSLVPESVSASGVAFTDAADM